MGSFGTRLLEFRKFKEKTQKEFASICGLSQANITHYENDINKPDSKNLKKIEKAFPDLNTEWLLDGNGEMLLVENQTSKESHLIAQLHASIKEKEYWKNKFLEAIEEKFKK